MPGITNVTPINLSGLTDIINGTDPIETFININHVIYDGYLWFAILWVLWVILFVAANKVRDQPLNNAMYSGAVVTVMSLLLRGVFIVRAGVVQGLLTDHQLWVFPLLTCIIAVIVYSGKRT